MGFTFRPRKVKTKDGKLMYGFSPSISRKKTKHIVATCRKLSFHRWTHLDIHQLSKALSPLIRAWIHYYGKFHLTGLKAAFIHLNRRLGKWAFNKYKRFKRRKSVYHALRWLRQASSNYQYLFPHWEYGFKP